MAEQEFPTEMDEAEVTRRADYAVRAADVKLTDDQHERLVQSIAYELHRAWHVGHSAGMAVSQSIYYRYKS